MRTISPTFTQGGFNFQLVERAGLVALFAKRKPDWNCDTYEVVKLRQRKACVMHGDPVPAHEAMPGNEAWGTSGWSYPTLAGAKVKFSQLQDGGSLARSRPQGAI